MSRKVGYRKMGWLPGCVSSEMEFLRAGAKHAAAGAGIRCSFANARGSVRAAARLRTQTASPDRRSAPGG